MRLSWRQDIPTFSGAPGLLVFGDTVTAEMLVTVRETASVRMSLTGWTLWNRMSNWDQRSASFRQAKTWSKRYLRSKLNNELLMRRKKFIYLQKVYKKILYKCVYIEILHGYAMMNGARRHGTRYWLQHSENWLFLHTCWIILIFLF